MKREENWQRKSKNWEISEVTVNQRLIKETDFVKNLFKYNTERQTWKEKIIFWEMCQGQKKENTFETNHITRPHVNVFYYITDTPKLRIKYLNF